MFAAFAPLLSSCSNWPFAVSNTRMSVPFSEAVAILVPAKFKLIQLSGASCAAIFSDSLSGYARSTISIWPTILPGKANNELFEFGQRTQRPVERLSIRKTQLRRKLKRPTLRVRAGLEFMKILGRQRECVDFDRVLEHHHNAIASKSTGFHVAWKLKFNYVLLLQIIMNQNWSERERGEQRD